MKFEYKITEIKLENLNSMCDSNNKLNSLGESGWELVTVQQSEMSNVYYAFLKRPIKK